MQKSLNFLLVLSLLTIGAGCTKQAENVDVTDNQDQEIIIDTDTSPDVVPGLNYTNASANDIVVNFPSAGDEISSPLTVTGQARGPWFFEATAPVLVVDWDGLIIGEGYIQATDDWMTEDFVDFEGVITFTTPTYKNNGAVIFKNDNPSGLSTNDKAVEISILFAESSESTK